MSEAYREAGVDIAAAEAAVERMRGHIAATRRAGVFGGFGGFGGGFALDTTRYREPVLISGTDGVGTKILIAQQLGRHGTIGIDCVAMCVNDILTHGAEPLFFLDYVATGRVDPARMEEIVAGVAQGCQQAGCALLGGETAEMPGLYAPDEYDLAGFAVGAVERAAYLDGRGVQPGDVVIGLPSIGLHSNGYSLARKILLDDAGLALHDILPELPAEANVLGEALLTPTRIYVAAVLALLERVVVHGMAHITGGGLLGNLPRVLPPGCQAQLDATTWNEPPIFAALQARAPRPLSAADLYTTWNMGIGYVCIVAAEDASMALDALRSGGEQPRTIGTISAGERGIRLATPHATSGALFRAAPEADTPTLDAQP